MRKVDWVKEGYFVLCRLSLMSEEAARWQEGARRDTDGALEEL
jgi:hypothetical protein